MGDRRVDEDVTCKNCCARSREGYAVPEGDCPELGHMPHLWAPTTDEKGREVTADGD